MGRQAEVRSWLTAGLKAIDPERLTADALGRSDEPLVVIAIGKAAPAMCRGAGSVAEITGLCVTTQQEPVPDGVELLIGDHPVPSTRSLEAGRRALELAPNADIALISGGGSALCEVPRPGIPFEFVVRTHDALVRGGASIEEANLVRAHLSDVKSGGLGSLPTLVISDVVGAGPEFVASGPTLAIEPDPDRVIDILSRLGLSPTSDIERTIRSYESHHHNPVETTVLADGKTAAMAVAVAAESSGVGATVEEAWIRGSLDTEVEDFIRRAGPGVTVAAGEPQLRVDGSGYGGRNSHAALVAATLIEGTEWVFAALATDGMDGNSAAAGGVVDGSTIERGGSSGEALSTFDSATYLAASGDLLVTGPTGTNVADIWLIWKP